MNTLKDLPTSSVQPVDALASLGMLMNDSLATHASLLERLKDVEDQDSWQEFYSTYRKLIFSFALKHGLTPTEAEDVVQDTVITVARNLPDFRYDPARCAFKTWLFNLTMWRIRDQLRKRRPELKTMHRPAGASDRTNTVERVPAPESDRLAAIWEQEWNADLFTRALDHVRERVQEKDFQIYDLYVVQGWSAREVATNLGVSAARVYLIKHRVGKLLAGERRALQRETEAGVWP